jgi:hypothetical protein
MGKLLVQIDADERRPALWRKASERRRALLRRVTVHTLTRTPHLNSSQFTVHTQAHSHAGTWGRFAEVTGDLGAVWKWTVGRLTIGLRWSGSTGPELAVACRASGAAQSRVSSTVAAAASSGKKMSILCALISDLPTETALPNKSTVPSTYLGCRVQMANFVQVALHHCQWRACTGVLC